MLEEKKESVELSNEELIEIYKKQDIINQNFNEDKFYGFDLDLYSFLLRCRYLKPQSYGLRLQAYLSTLLKYKATASSEDCGDFRTRENEDVELKCSFIDKTIRQFNVKQVRNWQDIDWYYVFTVDFKDYENLIYKCYKLTKRQMLNECDLINASASHSTKMNNLQNKKIEVGFSIKLNSDHYKRWEENYLNKKLDLEFLSEERLKEVQSEKDFKETIENYKKEVERLKINHPEEIEERLKNKNERVEKIIAEIAEDKQKKQLILDKLEAKRDKAYKLIPIEILMSLNKKVVDREINLDYYYALINQEIIKRFPKRKRRAKKDITKPLHITLNKFGKNEITEDIFLKDFKERWDYINSEEYAFVQKNKTEYKKVEDLESYESFQNKDYSDIEMQQTRNERLNKSSYY